MLNAEEFGGVLRAVLSMLGGVLVGKGVVDAATYVTVSGGLLTLGTAAWSVWLKKRARR